MALPKSKQELADWILRRLGAPVINIEISDEQLEDVIDESLQFYREYHFDGTDRVYRTIQITPELIAANTRPPLEIGNANDYVLGNSYISGNTVLVDGKTFLATQDLPVLIFDANRAEGYTTTDRILFDGILYQPKVDISGATVISNPVAGSTYKNVSSPVLDTDGWNGRTEHVAAQAGNNNMDITLEPSGQIGIRVPDNIISVSKVFKFDAFTASGIYSYDYQFFLNNFDFFYSGHGAGGGALTSYYIQRTYIEFIEHMINPQPSIRFNKHKNRLFIDTDWKRVDRGRNGQNFLLECYEVADPETYGDVYSDSWLKRYATALAKKQWGANLKKYEGTQLPGGITVNGQVMYDEGNNDATTLEDELKNSLQLEMDGVLIG